jgi:hypothetical protein
MEREELIAKCKELGMKRVSKLKDSELLQKITEHKPENDKRKPCKNCGILGHGVTSIHCKINIDKKDSIKQKVKDFFLLQDGSNDYMHFKPLSDELDISIEHCKDYYNEIPWLDLLRREKSCSSIVEKITFKPCEQCNSNKCTVKNNPFRTWKETNICDKCFTYTIDEREEIWRLIKKYKPIQCEFCKLKKDRDERYHFDHINMFDKESTIYKMVTEGVNIEEIFKEIDKCQILCISCHDIVTYTEKKLGFTKQKQKLTRKYNQEELTKEEYEVELKKYQAIYDEFMIPIYESIKAKHL